MGSSRSSLHLILAAATLFLPACCKHEPRDALPSEVPSAVEPAPVASPPRCVQLGKEVTVGPAAKADDDQDFLPFATEIGQGVAYDDGFAIAALTKEGQGTASVVMLVSSDGARSRTVKLGESHGDSEPPKVFGLGKTVGAGTLEPSGSKRALRLARVDGESVVWGAEFVQGNDESLAFDVALQEKRGVAVWDDLPKDREVSGILLATFDAATFAGPTAPRVMTLPGTDGDNPRLVARPGGFWLFWVARRPEAGDFDARYRAEDLAYKWLEVVPLDERGVQTGTARKIGSDSGHVLVYDVTEGRDGSALVMWRDDDTPSGSAGGRLMRALVRLGGVDGPDVIDDPNLGPGAPNVMQGWLAIADAASPTRIAPIASDGSFVDQLASEPLMGNGEPEAARDDLLLVSRPAGLAMKLLVAKCTREVRDAGVDANRGDTE